MAKLQKILELVFDNKKISNLFYFTSFIIIFFLMAGEFIVLINERNEINQYRSAFIFLLYYVIASIYLILARQRLKKELGMLRGMIRNEIISGKTERDEANIIYQYEKPKYKARYFFKHLLLFSLMSIIFYLIIFTTGLVNNLGKIGLLFTAGIYYWKFREDPHDLINSEDYDRQKVDLDPGAAAHSRNSRSSHKYR